MIYKKRLKSYNEFFIKRIRLFVTTNVKIQLILKF